MSSRKEEWWHPTLGHFTTALGQPLPWSLACSRVPFHTQPELLQCIPRFLVSASRLTFRCNRLRWKVSRQTGHGAVFDAVLSERETIECAHFMHPECPHARLTGFIITSKLQLIQIQWLLVSRRIVYLFSDQIRLVAEIIIFYWRPWPFFLRFSCSLYSYNLKNKFSNQRRKINLVNEPNCWVGGVRRTTRRTVLKLTKYCRRELLLFGAWKWNALDSWKTLPWCETVYFVWNLAFVGLFSSFVVIQ